MKIFSFFSNCLCLCFLLLAFSALLNPSRSNAQSGCISLAIENDEKCFSEIQVKELQDKIESLVKERDFIQIYKSLENLNIDNYPELLQSKSTAYFATDGAVGDVCEVVRDLEIVALYQPVIGEMFLDFIYNGAWKQIGSIEGSYIAKIRQAKWLIYRSKNKLDTTYKLSKYLFYRDVMSLLSINDISKMSPILKREYLEVRSDLLSMMKRDEVKIENLSPKKFQHKSVICPVR